MQDKRGISGPLIPWTAVTQAFICNFILTVWGGKGPRCSQSWCQFSPSPFPFISGIPARPILTIIGVFPLAQLTFFYGWSLANSPQQTFSHRLSFWLQKPSGLSSKLGGCWWLMELRLCERTPNIPQSSNLFLVLHHQKPMVHINEALSRRPGDFKIHQTLSKGQEELIWFTARDTHFLFW